MDVSIGAQSLVAKNDQIAGRIDAVLGRTLQDRSLTPVTAADSGIGGGAPDAVRNADALAAGSGRIASVDPAAGADEQDRQNNEDRSLHDVNWFESWVDLQQIPNSSEDIAGNAAVSVVEMTQSSLILIKSTTSVMIIPT